MVIGGDMVCKRCDREITDKNSEKIGKNFYCKKCVQQGTEWLLHDLFVDKEAKKKKVDYKVH
jgi:late competence protein required for DNA uptake (superfamily II DNA/RNA helicase)